MESIQLSKMSKNSPQTAGDFLENALNQTEEVLNCNIQEYIKIASSCAIGFAVMGAVGYFIKLVFIPINNIILSTN